MEVLNCKDWITGSGNHVVFSDVISLVQEYVNCGSKIFIGSDSFVSGKETCFATTLCLHGGRYGGRYFFYKESLPKNMHKLLVTRITEETRRSIELAEILMTSHNFRCEDMELHLDVSPFNANNGTSRLSDMMKGYVQGYGLSCRLKPNAWASQSVADKHSK
ncbi:hypothetical protein CL629_03040 [bacterium]|nr:hypothetical protein [bacterium]|tara:strand:+ start:564 stop:1049 length:486 start_codon:yes stop_codon:yes gene_type:complete